MLPAKKYSKIIKIAGVCLMALLAIFLLSNFSLAANNGVDVGLEQAAGTGLNNSQDIRVIIANITRVIIGFLGIIAVGLIIYAGWLWMTSEGNEEKVEQAKKLLINAVIGLIIILSAFAIASFILNRLIGSVGNNNIYPNIKNPGNGGGILALGSNIVSSHYPVRNQLNVARNTKIVITFKEAMDPASIMDGDKINKDNIVIYKTKQDGFSNPVAFDVGAKKTDDNKTFVFKPSQYLGSPTDKTWYTVALIKNIKKANGDKAFSGGNSSCDSPDSAYCWKFEVGTYIDNTPPQIESIIPQPSATEPRNVVVQINFSEAIDPISGSGVYKNNSGFNNIEVKDKAADSIIAGNYFISNQYQTVEFLTFDACGVNSCGQTIYCLPADKNLSVKAKAATLEALDAAAAAFPYTGIVDMADNSLDGNANGTAQGSESQSHLAVYDAGNATHENQGDDYYWQFATNDTIDITPPVVDAVSPSINSGGVGISDIPQATFSKKLMSSTINSSSVNFKSADSTWNYWVSSKNDYAVGKTTVSVGHDQFDEDTNYAIQFTSGIKDIYQNCYSPCSGVDENGNQVKGTPSCCDGDASNLNSCQ